MKSILTWIPKNKVMLCFWTKSLDEGFPVDVIYLDFQKAFDKLPYQRLLLKLKAHGIDWIEQ